MSKWELIVEFGAADGKVSLFGKALSDNIWYFMLKSQEYAIDDIPDDEETNLLVSENKLTGDWNQAVRLMNKYPWKSMRPIKIHPLFKMFLWDKVNYDNEYEDCSVGWYTKCFIPEEDEDLRYRKRCSVSH